MHCVRFTCLVVSLCATLSSGVSAHPDPDQGDLDDPFHQLDELWPTPDERRLASGAPGPQYWQQQVDYQIEVTLDDELKEIRGEAHIVYHNHSPHTLEYLWLQLEQNIFKESSASHLTRTLRDKLYYGSLSGPRRVAERRPGFTIHKVTDPHGEPIPHRIVDTMMRVDLTSPLKSGEQFELSIAWRYPILRHSDVWARSGYEDLKSLVELDQKRREALKTLSLREGDELPIGGESPFALEGPPLEGSKDAETVQRRIYEIAQWYPRLAAYTDVTGWQNKPFLGEGEFTLEFGDFIVRITAPEHFTVAATGELINPSEVLSFEQRKRLKDANTSDKPVWIITPEEARAQSALPSKNTKTWVFTATNVRDFAFAASNAYIWDAMGYHREGEDTVLAMSFYPPEAASLWSRYSTHAVLHTLEVYEQFSFPYPYPVALSVNGPVFGMEYPMISFNGVRPDEDGTYSKEAKYALISVIIHEVGHFFFPMIVNSDERQWTWLDEGINSFLQYQAERLWQRDYPSWSGPLDQVVEYMTSDEQRPIMTNSEAILQFGQNAYNKPAAALSMLRETIIGPDLFDEAFRSYARRWQFKRPMPSDFFRTLEDVSGVDLDWFWRGWFYGTAHVDVHLEKVRRLRLKRHQPELDKGLKLAQRQRETKSIIELRDEGRPQRVDRFPELQDFYHTYDPLVVTAYELEEAKSSREKLKEKHPDRAEELEIKGYFYELTLLNRGGLVTPLPLRLLFEDGSEEMRRVPAEVWRKNPKRVKIFLDLSLPLKAVEVDPYQETPDSDRSNNRYPQEIFEFGTFELKSWERDRGPNPIQRLRRYEQKQQQSKVETSEKSHD